MNRIDEAIVKFKVNCDRNGAIGAGQIVNPVETGIQQCKTHYI